MPTFSFGWCPDKVPDIGCIAIADRTHNEEHGERTMFSASSSANRSRALSGAIIRGGIGDIRADSTASAAR